MTRRAAAVSFGQSAQTIAGGHGRHPTQRAAFGSGRSWLLGQVPESVFHRVQYICNQVHFIYAFDDAYKFHQVAFHVSQKPFVGLYVHVIVLSGPRSHSIREHEIVLLNMSVGVYKMDVNDLIRME
jgi:hypothetical protein